MLKLFGSLLIIAGCGSVGFYKVVIHKREVESLKQFISILDFISSTLIYQQTSLPEICRQIGSRFTGKIPIVFSCFADELDNQISPDIRSCMEAALYKQKDIPKLTGNALKMLGGNLGHFGLDGQLRGIEEIRLDCIQTLQEYTENQDARLRTYQTLSLCAGAAIAILFI